MDDLDDSSSLNFDENQPLIDFENNLEFESLRAIVESDIVEWENSYPQNDFYPRDQYAVGLDLLTLINERCEIFVGTEIVNFCANPTGSILNPNFPQSKFSNPYYSPNKIDFCPFSPCCPYNYELATYIHPNNRERRMRVTVYSSTTIIPFGGLFSYQGGSIESQRQRNNGSWTRLKQKIKIVNTGGQAVSYFTEEQNPNGTEGCRDLATINKFHDDFKDRKYRNLSQINLTLTSWAFEDDGICTTGEIKNAILGSVCNAN